ncbi:MAG: hypothetical protein AB7U71_19755, partial [Comamonas sp.]
ASPSCIASALAMQLNFHQTRNPSSNLEPGLPLLIGTSTGGRSNKLNISASYRGSDDVAEKSSRKRSPDSISKVRS